MELHETAKRIIKEGSVRVRVQRSGMLQLITLKISRVKLGNDAFVELLFDRLIDVGELKRIANELGLPVEAQNGRAFPDGTGAKDFVNL